MRRKQKRSDEFITIPTWMNTGLSGIKKPDLTSPRSTVVEFKRGHTQRKTKK